MAPPSGLQQSAISSDIDNGLENSSQQQHHNHPALVRSATVPSNLRSNRPDPSHLAPEDAFVSASPPRRPGLFDVGGNGSGNEMRPRRMRRKEASRSRSRRRKRFQKLLWVKQSCA